MFDIKELVKLVKERLQKEMEKREIALGEIIYNNANCQVLSQSQLKFELIVNDPSLAEAIEYAIEVEDADSIVPILDGNSTPWDRYSYACLLQVENELHLLDPKEHIEHKKYTRAGMIKRVLEERRQKAGKAEYRIKWASNIYGDHVLTNEKGVNYRIFLRDFDHETGYSDCMDARLNKLGTTKHIMYAFSILKENKALFDKLDKTYPFIEVFCDPLNDYKITWHYPHEMSVDEQVLFSKYFKMKKHLDESEIKSFLSFIEESEKYGNIMIRPEVRDKVERSFENSVLEGLSKKYHPEYGFLNTTLFDYQKEGVEFVLFRKAAIIADEMGLGKTVQAIAVAILKKQIFGFSKTLIICPASLKGQWKSEIEKFSTEKAIIIDGFPDERALQYQNSDFFFFIVNYETVLRDSQVINTAGIDFMILDEAQKVKNYETKTASSVKKLNPKHILVITGTPIENRLIDIFSIMSIIDPHFFGPLWEFSYQYCLFDPERPNKINGYYNLQKLNKKLEQIIIRHEKRKVINQLPNLQQIDIMLDLSPLQADYHASYAKGIAQIIQKKFLTPYDLQKLQLLLSSMRMVCDSTYLIDDQTNESPKLDELQYILLEKLDIKNNDCKIIIFSEWVKVHKLIGRILRENNIGFVELNGKVPVKLRRELINKFESNPQFKIFLSTETGGTGLNLQVANILINFELPWNPAKKNQRIGRIDRLGQKSNKLTIYNFITRQSIEQQIAAGLLVKQNLFEGVLNSSSSTDFVDFSSKGRSQFIEQLERFLHETEKPALPTEAELFEVPVEETILQDQKASQQELDFSGDSIESGQPLSDKIQTSALPVESVKSKAEELESVMNSGMQFLAGLFKMSTGKDIGFENQRIEVNHESGEVTMKFKLPI
ncbi:MAG: DEAD/DEAH box helicase [Bacteroidetes bacterium]|nr:DEAD/DEAH box helicase [Bacteroidota bacterium]